MFVFKFINFVCSEIFLYMKYVVLGVIMNNIIQMVVICTELRTISESEKLTQDWEVLQDRKRTYFDVRYDLLSH